MSDSKLEAEEVDEHYLLLEQAYRGRLRWFYIRTLIAFAIVFFATAGTVAYVYFTSDDNRQSLCALRIEAETRVQQGEDFLKDHPEGIPGISVEAIRRGIDTSRTTVRALSNLNCDDVPQAGVTPPITNGKD